MISITTVLALFVLLALSTGVFYLAKRLRVPYTVLLVLTGLVLVPLVKLPGLSVVFGFLNEMQLTPELLFYIFLPLLIFESGFNMNIRRMIDSAWAISLLAVVGLLVSTLLISTGLYFVLPLIGLEIPFIIALLFGAIISATDPVAVLALFKEFGAPKRLTMIFEGESLFNDGTAVALFLVILGVATKGFHGATTVFDGILTFVGMVVFGVIIGLVIAAIFTRVVRYTRHNEFVTVTLLMISAHFVFIISELINETGVVHVSSIIATTVASLFLGNQARNILSLKTEEYLEKFIEHTAFIANSLVFLLAGLLFASLDINLQVLWLPILVTVLVVAAVRAIAVYAVTIPLNILKVEENIPHNWQVLLAWGSLRGALAIIIVLLIPENLAISGWQYDFTPRDFLLAITIGCILATLFVKAPLIGKIMHALKIDKPDPLTVAHQADLGIYYLLTEKSRFKNHKTRGFVREKEYGKLAFEINEKLTKAKTLRDDIAIQNGSKLFEQSLHLMAIHVERLSLRQLYQNGELSEPMFRRIGGKLNLQQEKIEYEHVEDMDTQTYMDRKDVFDRLVGFMQMVLSRKNRDPSLEERLQFYRAQMIMSRKAVKTLTEMQRKYDQPVFYESSFKKIVEKYDMYRQKNSAKIDGLLERHEETVAPYLSYLAQKALAASGARGLSFLHEHGIVNESMEMAIEEEWSDSKAI